MKTFIYTFINSHFLMKMTIQKTLLTINSFPFYHKYNNLLLFLNIPNISLYNIRNKKREIIMKYKKQLAILLAIILLGSGIYAFASNSNNESLDSDDN